VFQRLGMVNEQGSTPAAHAVRDLSFPKDAHMADTGLAITRNPRNVGSIGCGITHTANWRQSW